VNPLIYGYLRIGDDETDEQIRRTEHRIKTFARAEGYSFVRFYFEADDGSRGAFAALIEELRRVEAHHVIVPSLEHFSRASMLRNCMLDFLEREAAAHVFELGDGSWTT
jgi:DNA invertase Pin-like site-specific DNA recombinase